MKITVQSKIAELEQRIVELETRVAKMRYRELRQVNKEQDPSWLTKLCDVFFNGRAA